jgi:hypothetical protein
VKRACIATLLAVSAGGAASADPSTARAAATTTATPNEPAVAQRGVAVGVELGQPTSATISWWTGKLGATGAIGTGTWSGLGVSAHVGVELEVARLAPQMAVDVGLGGRIYHHGYTPMSTDEMPDTHYGAFASVALGYELGALRLYAEASPGVDVKRTASCSLVSGPYSICPHAQDNPLFVQLVVGARWFLSH